jgi:hypothetical protein
MYMNQSTTKVANQKEYRKIHFNEASEINLHVWFPDSNTSSLYHNSHLCLWCIQDCSDGCVSDLKKWSICSALEERNVWKWVKSHSAQHTKKRLLLLQLWWWRQKCEKRSEWEDVQWKAPFRASALLKQCPPPVISASHVSARAGKKVGVKNTAVDSSPRKRNMQKQRANGAVTPLRWSSSTIVAAEQQWQADCFAFNFPEPQRNGR